MIFSVITDNPADEVSIVAKMKKLTIFLITLFLSVCFLFQAVNNPALAQVSQFPYCRTGTQELKVTPSRLAGRWENGPVFNSTATSIDMSSYGRVNATVSLANRTVNFPDDKTYKFTLCGSKDRLYLEWTGGSYWVSSFKGKPISGADIPHPPVVAKPIANQEVRMEQSFNMYITGAFRDPDGDRLTYTATGLPRGLSLSGSSIQGKPSPVSADRRYEVTITAVDTDFRKASDSFYITVLANKPPVVAKPIPNQEARMERSFNLYIPGTFKDPDGGRLTYTVTGLPPGLSFSGNRIQGKPSPVSANKRSTVTVTAVDPDDGKASTSFYITVLANKPPVVAKPIPNQEARVGQSFNLYIPGTFKDPDGGSLTYTATGLPTGLSLSGSSIQGKPSPVKTDQSSTVTVTAVDPDDGKASTSFKITVRANQLPEVAKTIPNQEAREGELFEFSIPPETFKDPDGDSLIYAVKGLPKGLGFNSSNILGTPEEGTIGTYEVKVVAFDSNNGKASTNFKIQVKVKKTGAPPIAEKTIPNQSATEGQPFNFTIPEGTFTDRDGDTLKYEVQGLPDGLSFNPDTKEISGVLADGTGTTLHRVTVKVDDGHGNDTTSARFKLIVDSLGDTKEDLTEEIAAAKKMLKRIESVRDKGFAIGLTFDSPQQPDDYLKFFSARDLDFRFNVFIPNPNPSPNCKGVRLGDPSAAQADIDVLTQYIAEQEKYLQSLPK